MVSREESYGGYLRRPSGAGEARLDGEASEKRDKRTGEPLDSVQAADSRSDVGGWMEECWRAVASKLGGRGY